LGRRNLSGQLLVDHSNRGFPIIKRKEDRDERQDRRELWFKVLIPVEELPQPLFFELELTDDDPDVPAVTILNVHK
jgi:hypothetical protein